MTTSKPYLLDVNVLIALIDPAHVQHKLAHDWDWVADQGQNAWATCPVTQNGLLGSLGHARYPCSPGTPAAIAMTLASLCTLPGHVFWPDDISLMHPKYIDASRLLSSSQVTDSYMLTLACAHDGQLATFDRKLVRNAVRAGAKALCLI